ncbi:hypothetical protein OAJ60_04155 [Planctomycetaceae bacterium]|nr:hypothetical protein [Planctomycetaceae bacterium]
MPTELQKAYLETALKNGSQVPPDDSPIWRRGSVVRFGPPLLFEILRRQQNGTLTHDSFINEPDAGDEE